MIKFIDSKYGIKAKVLIGFVLIGVMLSLSGIVAFFEFGRMSDYVSTLISSNVTSVNTTRLMLNSADEYNSDILELISSDIPENTKIERNIDFENNMAELPLNFTTKKESVLADSVKYSYVAYVHVLKEIENMSGKDYMYKKDWYFNRLKIVYDKLRGYIQRLSHASQNSLAVNYTNLKDSFYRSIMPGVVAVAAGIILVILFNYFLNIFIIKPIIKINDGIKKYNECNKMYDVTVPSDSDQISQLNKSIKELIYDNKTLKRKF